MSIEAALRVAITQQNQKIAALAQELASMKSGQNVQDPLASLPGRRVFYMESGSQSFTTAQDGQRGSPINMVVSQDGPFIATHWPIIMWYPSTPSTATNYGRWRPVSTWPLPTQEANAVALTTNAADVISILYEVQDAGSGRNFQNQAFPPLISTPGDLKPLPMPTFFAPNSVIALTPTYLDISFYSGGTATTGGTLVVGFPGYKIVNL